MLSRTPFWGDLRPKVIQQSIENRWKTRSGERAHGCWKIAHFWKAAQRKTAQECMLQRKWPNEWNRENVDFLLFFAIRFCYAPCLKNGKNRGNAVGGSTAKSHQKRAAKNCQNLGKSFKKRKKLKNKWDTQKKASEEWFLFILLDFWVPWGAQIGQNPEKMHAKNHAFLGMLKKHKKYAKQIWNAGVGVMAGAHRSFASRLPARIPCIYLHAFEFMQGFYAGHTCMHDFMQWVDCMRGFYAEDFMLRKNAYDLKTPAGCGGFTCYRDIPPTPHL